MLKQRYLALFFPHNLLFVQHAYNAWKTLNYCIFLIIARIKVNVLHYVFCCFHFQRMWFVACFYAVKSQPHSILALNGPSANRSVWSYLSCSQFKTTFLNHHVYVSRNHHTLTLKRYCFRCVMSHFASLVGLCTYSHFLDCSFILVSLDEWDFVPNADVSYFLPLLHT